MMRQTAKRHFKSSVNNHRKPEGAGNYHTKSLADTATEFLRENGYDRNGRPIKTMDNYYK